LADRKDISRVYNEVTKAAVLGLVVNLLLGVVKLIGGIVGNSFALIADAVNSISVAAGHRIGHQVKDRLLERFPNLRDVLVHLEPFPHTHDSNGGSVA
jgi:divalent metal cation (Fe/Co/Zn/Cd) transporter